MQNTKRKSYLNQCLLNAQYTERKRWWAFSFLSILLRLWQKGQFTHGTTTVRLKHVVFESFHKWLQNKSCCAKIAKSYLAGKPERTAVSEAHVVFSFISKLYFLKKQLYVTLTPQRAQMFACCRHWFASAQSDTTAGVPIGARIFIKSYTM